MRVTGTRQGVCDALATSPLTGRLQALSKKTTRMAVEKLPWSYKQETGQFRRALFMAPDWPYLPSQPSSLLKIQLQHDRLESELVDFPMNWADRH